MTNAGVGSMKRERKSTAKLLRINYSNVMVVKLRNLNINLHNRGIATRNDRILFARSHYYLHKSACESS